MAGMQHEILEEAADQETASGFPDVDDCIYTKTDSASYAQYLSTPAKDEALDDELLDWADAIVIESRTTPHEEYDLEDKLSDDEYIPTDHLTDIELSQDGFEAAHNSLREVTDHASDMGVAEYVENVMDELRHREHRSIIQQNLENDQDLIYLVDLPSEASLLERFTGKLLPKQLQRQSMRRLFPTRTLRRAATKVHPMMMNPAGLAVRAGISAVQTTLGATGYLAKAAGRGETAASYLALTKAPTGTGLQSAVAAEKAESYIAPELGDELDRKPNILMKYDAKDADIAAYLRHPRLRRGVIHHQARLDYSLADTSYLDDVYEIDFDSDGDHELEDRHGTRHTHDKRQHETDAIEERDPFWKIHWPSKVYDRIKTHNEFRKARKELDDEYPDGARLRKLRRKHELTPDEQEELDELEQQSIEHARQVRSLREEYV
jgi:hypothetical protein